MKIWDRDKEARPRHGLHPSLDEARAKKRRVCAGCGEEKPWIYHTRIGVQKIYVDDKGKTWSAARCPECKRIQNRKATRKVAVKRKLGGKG